MTRAEPNDSDVVVVGMGPVGKMAALLLARAGHSVTILERKEATYALPRAVAHDAEIARILQSAGMPVDGMPDAVEPYDDLYVWVNADDEILHQVDWRGIDPSGWNNTYFYNQPALERHLDEQVRLHDSVTIRRGVSARVASQDDEGVDVEVSDLRDGTTSSLRAQYVLGADGANSSTRQSVEIAWHDLGYFFDWLVVDVVPGPGVEVTHLAKQVCDPARPTTVVPAGPGRRRWEFMRLEGETVESLVEPSRIWELLAPFGLNAGNAELERGVVYTFNSGWATTWSAGRVFLLGDAAHQMPPFAGQGLAAGFRDCVNLAWKLDLVLRGVARPSLLETYESERLAHVADFIDFSRALGRIICITDPEQAAARDREMIGARLAGKTPEPPPAPRLGAGLHRAGNGGTLSRQGVVSTTNRSDAKFDDVFGAGALVVRGSAAGLSAEAIGALGDLGIAVVVFEAADAEQNLSFSDAHRTYGEWFDEWGVGAVLIRPDFYVYGTSNTAQELVELVDDYIRNVTKASSLTSSDSPPAAWF